MAIRKIVTIGDETLRKHCKPQDKFDKRLSTLLKDMAETMYKSNGIGLAAPQIGKAIRVVVIDVGEGLIEMINPLITHREGKVIDSEGCLSVPNIFGDVERAEKVTVEFTNRFGKRKKLKAEQLLARCIQHELDHLDGVLFIDIAKSLRQEAANE